MEDLKGKTAIVTGGAKRIGRTICLALAEQGIQVVFTYRSSRVEAEQTLKSLERKGIRALAVKADLTEIKECDRLIKKSIDTFGKIDIFVNNASDFTKTPLDQLASDPKKFLTQFTGFVNLQMRAPLYLGIKLGLQMKKNGWGRIVNITDRVTVKGQAYRNWILYLVTKYGLYGINQTLAEELKPEVTVNAIAPGLAIPPEDFTAEKIKEMRERLPLKHEASPDEIAADVIHLIRSNSKTGSAILTDSGAGVHTY
jgi:NAD(P)-dependent dehydrogenase (short-subunit alcohol dehydrogenase family)